jgi:hypothetical protein
MRKRWSIAVVAVGVAGLITLACWPTPCPIELKLVSVEPADIIDDAGQMLCLLTLSVHNPNSHRLMFLPMTFEQRIANHWIEAPNRWTLGGVYTGGTAEEIFLIAPNADACRFRLKWAYDIPYPFGIGNCWARFNPPSPTSARVQAVIKSLSSRLYDSLWPPQPVGSAFYRKPHWSVGWTPVCSVNSLAATGGQMRGSDN